MYRPRNTYCMRATILAFLLLFVLLQIHLFNFSDVTDPIVGVPKNDSSAAIPSVVPPAFHKILKARTRNQTFSANFQAASVNHNGSRNARPRNITEIRELIAMYNELQVVLNEERFGPLPNDSVIVLIQVHTRITYLRHLIVSLARARDISKTLLIFSHDYFDEDINELVRSIDFCKVMQIFYPFSIQTHPNEFPGVDPNDCPRDMKRDQAIIRGCNNAMHPDLFGHYREASVTQIKHHWWWKANRVFDQLEVTRFHTGVVLFLEDDHYVAEDFLHVLELMEKRSTDLCPRCNVLSLGTYLKTFDYYTYISKVEVMPWIHYKHNMGYAFNRCTWRDIRRCAKHYCFYDDYNWDLSLQYVSQKCLKQKLYMLIVNAPRVFHTGQCGFHHKKKNCKSNQVISKVQQVLRIARNSGQLFPRSLSLTVVNVIRVASPRSGNGGWGDHRDIKLCLNMTIPPR